MSNFPDEYNPQVEEWQDHLDSGHGSFGPGKYCDCDNCLEVRTPVVAAAVDIDALTERLSLQDWRGARGGMYLALSELRATRAELAELRSSAAAVRAETLKEAANEVHLESRWQVELDMRGQLDSVQSIDRLIMLERILLDRAAKVTP